MCLEIHIIILDISKHVYNNLGDSQHVIGCLCAALARRTTWNLVQSTVGLDEASHNIPAAGQAVGNPTKHTCRNPDGKDRNHLVPGAAQHDLLCLEGNDCCQVARDTAQGPEVATHLAVYRHLRVPNLECCLGLQNRAGTSAPGLYR